MQDENELQDEQDAGPAPAKPVAKKPRKPRAPNRPKKKPADDKPVDIPDDHPALGTEPDPRIDAVAKAAALAKAYDEAEAAKDEAPQNVQVRKPGTWGEIEEQILTARQAAKDNAKEYIPPKPTERQQATIDAEMAAGQRRVAHFETQEKLRQQIPPDPNEPKNTPVFRPADHVPDMNSTDPATGKPPSPFGNLK